MGDVELIYIGSHFYLESGTAMSCIYEATTGARYDWSSVERDLRERKSVYMRPATDAEYGRYERRLRELKAKRPAPAHTSAPEQP